MADGKKKLGDIMTDGRWKAEVVRYYDRWQLRWKLRDGNRKKAEMAEGNRKMGNMKDGGWKVEVGRYYDGCQMGTEVGRHCERWQMKTGCLETL